jgi:hypothetical protein
MFLPQTKTIKKPKKTIWSAQKFLYNQKREQKSEIFSRYVLATDKDDIETKKNSERQKIVYKIR